MDCRQLFLELESILNDFLEEVNKKKLGDRATTEWSVKDVLGHITYWHQYYAQQYESLSRGEKPYFHRSLAGKNVEGRQKKKYTSKKKLIKELLQANQSLKTSILEKKVPQMRYMASRTYETHEFLEVVIRHIQSHTLQVRRAKHINHSH